MRETSCKPHFPLPYLISHFYRCKCGHCTITHLQNTDEAWCCQELKSCKDVLNDKMILEDVPERPNDWLLLLFKEAYHFPRCDPSLNHGARASKELTIFRQVNWMTQANFGTREHINSLICNRHYSTEDYM